MFQVKRILTSGACAGDRQLEVGDRLVSFNTSKLFNVSREECAAVLAEQSTNVRLVVLRRKRDGKRVGDAAETSSSKPTQQQNPSVKSFQQSNAKMEKFILSFQFHNTAVIRK